MSDIGCKRMAYIPVYAQRDSMKPPFHLTCCVMRTLLFRWNMILTCQLQHDELNYYVEYRPCEKLRNRHYVETSSAFDTLWLNDALWRRISWTSLVLVMACCLMTSSHHLNQCWLIISEILWHSSDDTGNAQDICPWYECENYWFKITAASPSGQIKSQLIWVLHMNVLYLYMLFDKGTFY